MVGYIYILNYAPFGSNNFGSNLYIAPVVGAALVAAGSSIIGGLLNSASSASSSSNYLQATRETNETNKQMVADTNQANLDLYREQFANSMEALREQQKYDSARSQVERLRAAGLNPAMAFGNGNVSNSASLPSASPMQSSYQELAPYDAYSDTVLKGVSDAVNGFSDNLLKSQEFFTINRDNQIKEAYSAAQIDDLRSQIQLRMENEKLSRAERHRLSAELEGLNLQNDLNRARYDDNVKLAGLQTKYQEIQNRALDEQNSRDAARLAIEQLEAASKIRLNDAQINQIKVLSNLAINQDWRDMQSHVSEINLRSLDYQLKRLDLDDKKKQVVFDNIMRQSEAFHTILKDNSKLNQIAENAFGLGFRDLGTAIRNLISK